MAGFWDSLGSGLQDAGAILSPQVNAQQNQERQQGLAVQQRQRELMAQTIISQVQAGAIDKAAGAAALQKLGFGQIAGIGPTPQAQEAALGLQMDQRLFGQPGATPGPVAPPTGMGQGGLAAPAAAPGALDPAMFMGPRGQAWLAAQKGIRDLQKPVNPPVFRKIAIDDTHEQDQQSLDGGQTWTPVPGSKPRPIFKPDSPAVEETPFMKESRALAKLVTEGKGNTQEARDLRAHLAKLDAPPRTTVVMDGGGKVPAGYRMAADGKSLEFIPGGPADPARKEAQLGSREATFLNRVLTGAAQGSQDLANIANLPLTASTGFFGGRHQGPSLFDATKEVLANKVTSQEVQDYNVMATGFQRSLAAIEAAGLMPSGMLSNQMESILFKEGDTNLTKVRKLAQTRQIIEQGLDTAANNPRVPDSTKQYIGSLMKKVKDAVPFTQNEITELMKAQQTNPKATLRTLMNKMDKKPAISAEDQALIDKYKK